MGLLIKFDWPGNVRQFRNEVERAIALAHDGETITPIHLRLACGASRMHLGLCARTRIEIDAVRTLKRGRHRSSILRSPATRGKSRLGGEIPLSPRAPSVERVAFGPSFGDFSARAAGKDRNLIGSARFLARHQAPHRQVRQPFRPPRHRCNKPLEGGGVAARSGSAHRQLCVSTARFGTKPCTVGATRP